MARVGALLMVVGLVWLVVATPWVAGERRARRKVKQHAGAEDTASLPPQRGEGAAAELKVEVTHRPETCDRKTALGDTVDVHYVGQFEDGQPFDSSISRQQPFTLTLGQGQVIPGWEQGLLGMCVDEMRKLTIPPHLAYGEHGYPPVIPPRATLVFLVKLVSIHEPN